MFKWIPSFTSFTSKLLAIFFAIVILISGIYLFWQKNKFSFIKTKISSAFLARSDSLYSIQYDSLYFNDTKSLALLKNISIIPDTSRIKSGLKVLPYAAFRIDIKSITLKGVRIHHAIDSHQLIGDSIIIERPIITAYILRNVKKETKVNFEAKEIYRQILNRIKLCKVGNVIIKHAQVRAINFRNYQREFELFDANIELHDVLIDSLNKDDTTHVLFCKNAGFSAREFIAFNNNCPQIKVDGISFIGYDHKFILSKLAVNRFDNEKTTPLTLLVASNLAITGLDNKEFINNKNISLDSIFCGHILYYCPPSLILNHQSSRQIAQSTRDTTGFRATFSLEIKNIHLPSIDIIKNKQNVETRDFKVGKISMKIRNLESDAILEMQEHPLKHIREFELHCTGLDYQSPDKLYQNQLLNIQLNSSSKKVSIGKLKITPGLSETEFANKAKVQKDRYCVEMNHIVFDQLDLAKLFNKSIIARKVEVGSSTIDIFRDLSKPLDGKDKIGNFPQEVLKKSNIPINVKEVFLNNTLIRYKERSDIESKSGTITFQDSKIRLSNVNNVVPYTEFRTKLDTKVLGKIPLSILFNFPLSATDGEFFVKGSLGEFNMKDINSISKTMALIEIDAGEVHGANFDFIGNDNGSLGHFTMTYDHLRVALLKKDKDDNLRKRSIVSLLANAIIKNQNPNNGKLRTLDVKYERERSKSFFSLVWKSIFTGLKSTVGLPMPKIK